MPIEIGKKQIKIEKNNDEEYRLRATLVFKCKTHEEARNLAEIIKPENKYINKDKSDIRLDVKNSELWICFCSNEKNSTIRSTLDDLLFTIITASNVGEIIKD